MMFAVYRALTFLAAPLARPLLSLRAARGHESADPARRAERLGIATLQRPEGPVFWFDAVSVGESNSAMPMIDFVLEEFPGASALVTTTNVTAARNMEAKLASPRAFHQFLPLDRGAYANRFLDHWRPSAGFFIDSDFWPNLLLSAHKRRIPLILLNGRISNRSYERWMRHRAAAACLMSTFAYALAKSDGDAKKLSDMGMASVDCVGNLKYGAPPLPCDAAKVTEIESAAGGRASWMASVTYRGEEEHILSAHRAIRDKFPGALLVIVPRHPERGGEVLELARSFGFTASLESSGDKISRRHGVYISDILGGLGPYYKYFDIVFIGCSLLGNMDGQNPMEAARLGAAILSGPYVDSFIETYDIMKRSGAVTMLPGPDALSEKVAYLLSQPGMRAEMKIKAKSTAEREAAVLDRAKEKLRAKFRELGIGSG
ncbi:MAG: 3-deoxy-D-manno-octulosonic acid transferase [Synergistaceae bacterium]|jgi:3-deoxy-D-manno-octulosonic-acid transferase|nr:3-deoxy-D-manno-octulosonic acid transferase [Synergistaceae bacterium]